MWGSDYFKIVSGEREHVGYKYFDLPVPDGGVIRKGTWVDDLVDGTDVQDCTGVLASGFGVGFLTQDIDANGLTGLQGFQNFIIGKLDNPAKNGIEVAVAKPTVGSEFEYEGAGTAIPGNLVCTSGTGAIATSTARKTQLSFLNGCLRIAQSGEIASLILLAADLEPVADDSNVRIRVMFTGPNKVP
jgi:hypothetical protein